MNSGKKGAKSSSTFSCKVIGGLIVFLIVAGIVFSSLSSNNVSNRPIVKDQQQVVTSSGQVIGHDKKDNSSPKETNSGSINTERSPTLPISETQLDEEIINRIQGLRKRSVEFLNWVTKEGDSNPNPPFIRWDLISKADIHIVHTLVKYIDFHMENPTKRSTLENVYKYGYQCSKTDMVRQALVSKFINMDICSEVEWYKYLHLAWPEASTFMDVGANKGYLGSLFLTLWGGSALKASPADLYTIATKLEAWKTSRNPKGYCKDGDHYGVPMYCPANSERDSSTGHCSVFNPKTRVYSLDGSNYLTQTLTNIISLFPGFINPQDKQQYRAADMWNYRNFAVSDSQGTARFTKQTKEKNPGFEGGGIRSSSTGNSNSASAPSVEEEEVPMVSVDHYIQQNNISAVDLLKIDTEGNDNKVLRGAKKALASSIGMFAFEGGRGITFSKDMIVSLDKIGYSCYSTSRAGLFKWNGGCMPEEYMGGFAAKDKGNIFCINRRRAPLAAFAYDAAIFPAMFNLLTNSEYVSRLDQARRQQLRGLFSVANATATATSVDEISTKVDPSMLFASYINIRGFCQPWPSCARI